MDISSRAVSVIALAGLAVPLVLGGCGDDDGNGMTGPSASGDLEVAATTTGEDQDADGYDVTLDDDGTRSIDPNGSVLFEDVATGEHTVELGGIADNCGVDGDNPVTVEVSEGSTAEASFDVRCLSGSGDLQVDVTTSGEDQDPDGYTLTRNGEDSRQVDANGQVVFEEIDTGEHTLELTDVAESCTVEGDNPSTVEVSEGPNNTHEIQVSCAAAVSAVIAFSTNRDGDWEVYLMDEDGSNPENLTQTPDARDVRPMTSRDGSRITFVSDRDGSDDVWTMLPDGNGTSNLTEGSDALDHRPTWFPGGDSLVFVSDRDGNSEIYVMDEDGEDVTRLTDDGALDTHPAVSPDGDLIAFASDRGASSRNIWVMNADGSGTPEQLTSGPGNDERPTWSPDGSQIAFQTDRDGDQEIYVMEASDGSGQENLTNLPEADDAEPAYSPEGDRIAFISDRDGGQFDVYVMDAADGSNVENLSETPDAREEDPAWDN